MATPYDQALRRLSRRQFIDVAWKLGAAAAISPAPSEVWARPNFARDPFTMGVASGDPLPESVVLWTRLAPEPLDGGGMPTAAVEVAWEIAFDDGMKNIAQSGTKLARPELGHSVHAEIFGLQPGRDYWYRFRVGDAESRIGRTRTAPAAGAPVDRLRFGFCGCSDFEAGYFTAFAHMAGEDLDFIFHSGDYIYEHATSNNRVRQHHGGETYTIVDYRNRYAQYKSDPDLMAVHASSPFIVTWDDHEVDNDWAGEIDQDDSPPEVFLLRRAAAFQAYYEAMPLRRAQFPRPSRMQLHRAFHFGSLMTLSALDTRQYRSDQGCGGGARSDCREAAEPARTMLGADQEGWLESQLRDSRANWNVIAQQVPIFGRDFAATGSGRYQMDKWDGYLAARERLVGFISDRDLANVVFLSGDVHSHWGANVPRHLEEPEGPAVAVEFTNSSISSNGDGGDVRPEWPVIEPDNPHVRFHSDRRGYVTCDVTPETWRTDFMVIDRVSVPGGRISLGGRLAVERGQPYTQRA